MAAGTQRNNNVFITSKRRRWRRLNVMKTLSLRHYCVMRLGWNRSFTFSSFKHIAESSIANESAVVQVTAWYCEAPCRYPNKWWQLSKIS